MDRWSRLDDVPVEWGRSVVAIGVFDGVHVGHRTIVARAVAAADELRASSVVVTFDPHPSTVVRPEAAPLLLGYVSQRLDLLASLGVDATFVLPFDREMSSWSAEEFVQRVLVDRLHARRIVVGENFRFGNRALGDVALLAALGADRYDFDVDAVPLVGDGGDAVSSTMIRELVAEGDVAAAATALGRPYGLGGTVVRGDGRGRELGFPTANLALPPGLAVPADGVYAGWLIRADGSAWPAAISVGTNPTFDGVQRRVEAYVLDADFDLYGENVRIDFADRLRGQVRFGSVGELVEKIGEDVEAVRTAAKVKDR